MSASSPRVVSDAMQARLEKVASDLALGGSPAKATPAKESGADSARAGSIGLILTAQARSTAQLRRCARRIVTLEESEAALKRLEGRRRQNRVWRVHGVVEARHEHGGAGRGLDAGRAALADPVGQGGGGETARGLARSRSLLARASVSKAGVLHRGEAAAEMVKSRPQRRCSWRRARRERWEAATSIARSPRASRAPTSRSRRRSTLPIWRRPPRRRRWRRRAARRRRALVGGAGAAAPAVVHGARGGGRRRAAAVGRARGRLPAAVLHAGGHRRHAGRAGRGAVGGAARGGGGKVDVGAYAARTLALGNAQLMEPLAAHDAKRRADAEQQTTAFCRRLGLRRRLQAQPPAARRPLARRPPPPLDTLEPLSPALSPCHPLPPPPPLPLPLSPPPPPSFAPWRPHPRPAARRRGARRCSRHSAAPAAKRAIMAGLTAAAGQRGQARGGGAVCMSPAPCLG